MIKKKKRGGERPVLNHPMEKKKKDLKMIV